MFLPGWPFLQEGIVHAISDEQYKYELCKLPNGQTLVNKSQQKSLEDWRRKAEKCEALHSKKLGIITGTVKVLAHVLMLKGI